MDMDAAGKSNPLAAKLNFLLIHGIGSQNPQDQVKFLNAIEQATAQILQARRTLSGVAGTPPGSNAALNVARADWSTLYHREKDTWLASAFPRLKSGWKLLLGIVIALIAITIILRLTVPGLTGLLGISFTGFCQGLLPPKAASGCAESLTAIWETLLMLIIGGAVLWGYALRFVPWGNIFSLLRTFEARTLSDVMIYCGTKGQREIVYEVCKCLLKMHPDPLQFLEYFSSPDAYTFPMLEDRPRLVLGGHSQGSVIAFEMLEGSARYMRWHLNQKGAGTKPSMRKQLDLLVAGKVDTATMRDSVAKLVHTEFTELQQCETSKTPTFSEIKLKYDLSWDEGEFFFYRLLEFLNMSFAPVGMVTFGSPVPLFMFRQPDQIPPAVPAGGRLEFWKKVCPPGFIFDTVKLRFTWQGITWRWQNFWHCDDFVAHRMETLFNGGLTDKNGHPTGEFVQDVRCRKSVRDPISAHSLYWRQNTVIEAIAVQLANTIGEMQQAPASRP